MRPRAIREVANLAPNTKLGEVLGSCRGYASRAASQRATNNNCKVPRLAQSRAQSMDGLMEQLSAAVQLNSITD